MIPFIIVQFFPARFSIIRRNWLTFRKDCNSRHHFPERMRFAIVTAESLENLKVKITSGNHSYISDEPLEIGGDNLGPNPYELLLGSLAACKLMTVRMYARRKGWPLESVRISLDIHREYAKDCEECISEGNMKVSIIDCEISFSGELNADQKERLKSISERCPVHQTLVSETVIRTNLKDD